MPTKFDPHLVLSRPLMAILSTVTATGEPRNAPVWFAWEAEALWMLSDISSSSAKRIAANPCVAVEIVDHDNEGGLLRHLGMRGTANAVVSQTTASDKTQNAVARPG